MRVWICLALLLPVVAEAMTIADLAEGQTVLGPKLSVDDMKGKIVYVEYWGTHCPPCIGALPNLAELYKKYAGEGVHFIGLECQGSRPPAILKLCEGSGVTYQITISGGLKGANVTGIPHGFLFDADGELISEPHPSEVEAGIKEALKRVPSAMLGAGPYVKLAKLVAQVKKGGKDTGAALKKIRGKTSSKDEAEAAEAKMLIEALTSAVAEQIDKALDDKESNPAGAVRLLDRLATQFSGDDLGAKAQFDLDNLKKDPSIKKLVDAEAEFARLEALTQGLRAYDGMKDPSSPGFKKVNAATLTNLCSGCQAVIEKYPETAAAAKAQALLETYK